MSTSLDKKEPIATEEDFNPLLALQVLGKMSVGGNSPNKMRTSGARISETTTDTREKISAVNGLKDK